MSSFDAAPAASTHLPVAVIAREMLYTGAVVEVKIPIRATAGAYLRDGEEISYIRFIRTVTGGRVNFFLHTADLELRGKHIHVSVSVLRKTLADERQYLYVHMTPTSEIVAVTHQLLVLNNGDRLWTRSNHLTFETPPPLQGRIIFTPRDFVAGRAE